MKPQCMPTKMKVPENYFHVVLFMLYRVVLTMNSVDETPVCDYSNERYRAILLCGTGLLC